MSTIPSRDDLARTNRIFEQEVIEKGDYGALQRVYTKDARALPPGAETVRGRESIQAFWKQAVAEREVHRRVEAGRRRLEVARRHLERDFVAPSRSEAQSKR